MRRLWWIVYCCIVTPIGVFALVTCTAAMILGCFAGFLMDSFHRGAHAARRPR